MPDLIPRRASLSEYYEKPIEKYRFGVDISQYYNDEEIDAHLFWMVNQLRDCIIGVDADPDNVLTTDRFQLELMIVLDTGDGRALKAIIEKYKPLNIIVAVNRWEDFASSFDNLDWTNLWDTYSKNCEAVIGLHLEQTNDPGVILRLIASKSIPMLDHAFIYFPYDASDEVKELAAGLNSRAAINIQHYLGFVQDEYNMVRITADNLTHPCKIYRPPLKSQRLGNVVVVASGPSLDDNIEVLRNLQSTHLIVAAASSFGTLHKNGIRVDVVCIVERGYFYFDDYYKPISKYGKPDSMLISAIVSDHKLSSLFSSAVSFYRSALTPFSLFAHDPQEALPYEGPQSVNTAHSFVERFNPASILLIGADLGTVDPERKRSKDAVGYTPREFTIETKPNQPTEKVAYTDRNMEDVRNVLEKHSAEASKETLRFNLSNGVHVKGFSPVGSLKQYLELISPSEAELLKSQKKLCEWLSFCRSSDSQDFLALWNKGGQRRSVFQTISKIRTLLANDSPDTISSKTYSDISISLDCSAPRRDQFAQRIIRGCVLKSIMCIRRQTIILSSDTCKQRLFVVSAKERLLELLNILENELYLLCDDIEREIEQSTKARANTFV